MKDSNSRIEIIDALRGFAVVLMVAHHLLYNLVTFLGAPGWFFSNPAFDVLQPFFAGLFIFLSGVSSRFSRSNVKRGLIAFALALVISAVTTFMRMPIWFGVLHLLGFSMLFFGLTRKFWDFIPRFASLVIFVSFFVASLLVGAHFSPRSGLVWVRGVLFVLGWSQPGFVSFDYFPLMPWLFVFLLGSWAGLYVRDRWLPGWFYEVKVPVFPAVGRKALLVYIVHQPVLYGIVIAIAALR